MTFVGIGALRVKNKTGLSLFPAYTTIFVCSLFCLCTLVAYFRNNMDPDQTAPMGPGFLVFDSMLKVYSCRMKTHYSSDEHSYGLSKAVQNCVIDNYYLGQMQCFGTKISFPVSPLTPDVKSASKL